jgi:hypothetical protein
VSSDDELLEIRAGPRWDAVLTAVADAEAGLEQPLTDDELDGGWTEELCAAILSDVRRVRDELAAGAGAGVALKDWTGVDVVDPDGDVRADVIFDVDLALGDLERAERLLYEVTRLLGELASPGSRADVEQGFDDEVRAQLRSMLDELRRVLATGEYLSREEMDPWADALRTYGFLRAAPAPGLDANASAAETGFTLQRIEQFPPGRRWEDLAIFDGWLCNVAWTDVLDDVAGGQDDASDDREEPPD